MADFCAQHGLDVAQMSPSLEAGLDKRLKEAGGDLERVKRVTGRLKELFFAAHGGYFTMAAFKHARTREDYGSSR